MYVRIARFDGMASNWDERIEEVRNRFRGGGSSAAAPLNEVRHEIVRAMMLVDREKNRGASVLFCDSEVSLLKVDEAMNRIHRLFIDRQRRGEPLKVLPGELHDVRGNRWHV